MKRNTIQLILFLLLIPVYTWSQGAETVSLTDPAFTKRSKSDTLTDQKIAEQEKTETLYKKKGYMNFTQAGIGIRLGKPVFSISTVNGYQFSPHMALGFGVGFLRTYYPLWNWRSWKTQEVTKSKYSVGINELTLFIQQRFFPGHGKSSPVIMFDFGYALALPPNDHEPTPAEQAEWQAEYEYNTLVKTTYDGGVFFAPGFGAKTNLGKKLSLNFSLQVYFATYRRSETEKNDVGNIYYYKGSLKMNLFPIFNIGVGF
jgi:hypothetical protein